LNPILMFSKLGPRLKGTLRVRCLFQAVGCVFGCLLVLFMLGSLVM
jgi:hypothetical protein